MAKTQAAKRRAWNKGVEIGQKGALTPDQVRRVRQVLARREGSGLRDLTLFSVAIDTMLHGPELLNLTVKDVQRPDGAIRSVIKVTRPQRRPPVRCALSKASATALKRWIAVSGKKRTDYIFPSRRAGSSRPMTVRQLSRLLKLWIALGTGTALMQCSINCNDEGTCDEGASVGPPSDLPQLGNFSAAVFCVKASKIVQSRAANSAFSQRLNAWTCGRSPPRLGRTR